VKAWLREFLYVFSAASLRHLLSFKPKFYFMQKNFYLLMLFISTGLASNAQVKKGNWLLGGDVSFNAQNVSEPLGNSYSSGTTTISLSPSLGKAIRDNFILGFDLNYLHSQSTDVDQNGVSTKSKIDEYGLGVFLREYKPLGKGFSLFAQERLGGNYEIGGTNSFFNSGKTYNLSLGITPSLAYAVCGRLQVEVTLANMLSISYYHQGYGSDPNTVRTKEFNIGTNLNNEIFQSVEFGFRFLLGS
jgi:hypothetical protein